MKMLRISKYSKPTYIYTYTMHVKYVYVYIYASSTHTHTHTPFNGLSESLLVRVARLHKLVLVDTTTETEVVWNAVLLHLQNLTV